MEATAVQDKPKAKRGRPRKKPLPVVAAPAEQLTGVINSDVTDVGRTIADIDARLVELAETVDYSKVLAAEFLLSPGRAVRFGFGASPGMLKPSFGARARKCVDKHWPNMRKSATRKFLESKSLLLTTVFTYRAEQVARFCDLIETMMADGLLADPAMENHHGDPGHSDTG